MNLLLIAVAIVVYCVFIALIWAKVIRPHEDEDEDEIVRDWQTLDWRKP